MYTVSMVLWIHNNTFAYYFITFYCEHSITKLSLVFYILKENGNTF